MIPGNTIAANENTHRLVCNTVKPERIETKAKMNIELGDLVDLSILDR